MTNAKLVVYVGQALTGAPTEFVVDFQNELKSELRKLPDIEAVLDFVGLEGGSSLDVFNHDKNCTENAGLCVFVVDHASTGLGMEIMIRHCTGREMLCFAKKNSRVTRMLLGFLEWTGRPLHHYSDVSDIIKMIEEYIRHLKSPE